MYVCVWRSVLTWMCFQAILREVRAEVRLRSTPKSNASITVSRQFVPEVRLLAFDCAVGLHPRAR
eukprot:2431965-Rhodomonas_salina.1